MCVCVCVWDHLSDSGRVFRFDACFNPATSGDDEHRIVRPVCSVVGGPEEASLPNPPATMIMDGLDTLPAQHHHHHHHHASAFLLTESAAAAHHFNVLSFDTCLYKTSGSVESGGSPVPAAACSAVEEPPPSETQPGDLNTPVTTSGDVPSFFGPSTVVEPPPIAGESQKKVATLWTVNSRCKSKCIALFYIYSRDLDCYMQFLCVFNNSCCVIVLCLNRIDCAVTLFLKYILCYT